MAIVRRPSRWLSLAIVAATVAMVAPSVAASGPMQAVVLDPLVRLASPSYGAYLSNGETGGSATWKATAVAQGGRRIVRMELLANGIPIATDTTAPFGGTFSTAGLPVLTTLQARATDSAGGSSWSRSRPVTVHRPALDGGWLGVMPPVRVSTTTALLARPLQVPGIDVLAVTWTVDGIEAGTATAAPWTVDWTAPATPEDGLPVTVTVTDKAGSVVSIEGTIDVVDDGASVAIASPAPDASLDGTVTVDISASPPIGPGDVLVLHVDGEPTASAIGVDLVEWDSRSVDDGAHVIHVVVDRASAADVVSGGTPVEVVNPDEPRVSMTRTPSSLTVRTPVTVTPVIEGVEADPVAGIIYEVGAVVVYRRLAPDVADFEQPFTWSLPDGVYRVRLIVELQSGRILRTADEFVNLLRIRSWIRWPPLGSTVSGPTVKLEAAVVTDGEAFTYKTTFLVDGVFVGATRNTFMYWDSTTATNGSHTVVARTLLTDGRQVTTGALTFTVSN